MKHKTTLSTIHRLDENHIDLLEAAITKMAASTIVDADSDTGMAEFQKFKEEFLDKIEIDYSEFEPGDDGFFHVLNFVFRQESFFEAKDIQSLMRTNFDDSTDLFESIISDFRLLRSRIEGDGKKGTQRHQAPGIEDDDIKAISTSVWTGIESPRERLVAIRAMLPIARDAISSLITELTHFRHNNGPALTSDKENIQCLRDLHAKLGQILDAIDSGKFLSEYGDGLVAEVMSLAERVKLNVKEDPLPYGIASLLFGVLTLLGFPTWGGFAGATTFQMTKKRSN